MYEWNVVRLNIYGNRIQVRWKILSYRIPQFIYESKSERIIEIGPHLPKLS